MAAGGAAERRPPVTLGCLTCDPPDPTYLQLQLLRKKTKTNMCYHLCPSFPESQQGALGGSGVSEPRPPLPLQMTTGPHPIVGSVPKHGFYPVGQRELWEVFEQERDKG